MADNILRRGIVADDSDDNPHAVEARQGAVRKSEYDVDSDVAAIREFNDLMVKSDRLETFVVPLYDGLSVGRLLD